MNSLESQILLISIPFTYGFVGWVTNWLALKMTFYPLRFWGIPPFFGWQGIIPRKADKIGSKFVEVITERLLNVKDLVLKLDPNLAEKEILPSLEPIIQKATTQFANSIDPNLWNQIPAIIREEILLKIKRESGNIVKKVIKDLQVDIDSKLDIKNVVYRRLTGENVKIIVEMFQEVGGPEFKFIEKSGFIFGFLLGLVQMVFWYFFPLAWTLPVQGIIVGYLTNYLAIEMIFRPLEPKVYFGKFKYQGLFLKRQKEVSQAFAKIVSEKILSPKNILEELLYGKAAVLLIEEIREQIAVQVDRLATITKPVILASGKWGKYEEARLHIAHELTEATIQNAHELEGYIGQTLKLEEVISEKMILMPPREFETILRSAFQEDEFLLILIGATLGAIVGASQILIL
ncbi:MAG: DUF445 family protein [Leptospira sp.]|nr:DUF445 family protein [Leptospira sp.]